MAEIPLNREQAAHRLGVATATLDHWRTDGIGPAYHKVGGRVAYFESDITAWLASRRVEPEGERPPRRGKRAA